MVPIYQPLETQEYLRGMMRQENLSISSLKVLKLEDFAMHSPLILNFKVNFFFKTHCYLGLACAFQCNLYTLRPWLFCEGQNSHTNNEDVIYCNEADQQFQASGSLQQD